MVPTADVSGTRHSLLEYILGGMSWPKNRRKLLLHMVGTPDKGHAIQELVFLITFEKKSSLRQDCI